MRALEEHPTATADLTIEKPAGVDDVRPQPVLRFAWRLYTRFGLPALGRLVSRHWYEVGRFLGPSITGFYDRVPLERLAGMWRDAGFGGVGLRRMSFGAGVVMWGTRDGDAG